MRNQQNHVSQCLLPTLVAEADTFLGQQNYCKDYAFFVQSTWRTFLHYAQNAPDGNTFSIDLVQRFEHDQYGFPLEKEFSPVPKQVQSRLRAMRMLIDFAIQGQWTHCGRTTALPLTPENQMLLDAFIADWHHRGLSDSALRSCLIRLRQFLLYLQARNLSYSQLTPTTISGFVTQRLEFQQKTIEMITYYLRAFFNFLYLKEYLPRDWSSDVPKVRGVPRKRIPSTWRREDVNSLLATVDRGSPVGKRDYAILLLVVLLGLRASDIRELRLEHFQWEIKELTFPQAKTGQVVSLPLLDDIGWAVIDYLQHGRPMTQAREVFVQHIPPFAQLAPTNSLHSMINRYRQRANIPLPPEQRHGLHSLRHTLASALLEQQTPLSTIAAILGHLDSGSTEVYLKVNLTQLRQCALEVEEVTDATA
ncbi:MAG: tyrosine-type recombinase/integrase [Armatimonadota bacterium]